MMQPFRISDALRCSLLNAPLGPNLAGLRDDSGSAGLRQHAALWKHALTQPPDRIMLGWWDGLRMGGLVSARTHAGCRVWEVDHLYLPETASQPAAQDGSTLASDGNTIDLLERLVQAAGLRSAERILLRLPADSGIIDLARRSGFFPCYEETLFEDGEHRVSATGDAPPLNLRSLLPSDEYALFQLFNAATPAAVRLAMGLTFDQWRDAREVHRPRGPQWVTECECKITGWLEVPASNRRGPAILLVHPDRPDLVPGLVNLGHRCLGSRRWLLADYQESIARYLEERGFQPRDRYTMLVKTVAAPAMRPGMVQVGA